MRNPISIIKRKSISLFYRIALKLIPEIQYHYRSKLPLSNYPVIFNSGGEKLKMFFLAERPYASKPYSISSSHGTITPKYILWDRYNYGLKTHFYAFTEAFRLVGNPDIRFAILNESHSIVPQWYKRILRNKSYMEKEFEFVFTYDNEVLDTLGNAKFVPFDANYWYGREDETAISPENYKNKDKNVSIIASHNTMCPMHIVRQNTARLCKANGWADTFGTFTHGGGGIAR